MLALAVVFVSIVTVTGYSGHITLMSAAIAGMGSFFTGRLATGAFLGLPGVPVILAMILGALACVPVGLAAAYPALRRRGLFLGLTTLAFGLVIERYVFNSFYLNPGPRRPRSGCPALSTPSSIEHAPSTTTSFVVLASRHRARSAGGDEPDRPDVGRDPRLGGRR